MESLSETTWDVILSGTGIAQSLLALALSRSGKKVLHVDRNDYYGGDEAALSLHEVDSWVKDVNEASKPLPFRNAVLDIPDSVAEEPKLRFSRAYSLSLSPQLIYARSNLLPALVSSKVYRQLEFVAVGSWWIYKTENDSANRQLEDSTVYSDRSPGCLSRIPGGREDVFGDKSIDLRSARSVMKFLKLAADPEAYMPFLEEWGVWPFSHVLRSHFKIPLDLQGPIVALTSSYDPPSQTTTEYAITRIHRHLTSIGRFGPGFGSVIPKWGGLAEIAQVACRAGAVGGGVYVLKQGIESINVQDANEKRELGPLIVQLQSRVNVKAYWIVGAHNDLPEESTEPSKPQFREVYRSITIVSSPLHALFPSPSEGAPTPAGAVIVLPSGSVNTMPEDSTEEDPPVYLMVHSSDTGECPNGQSIIYASTSVPLYASLPYTGSTLLIDAIQKFLATVPEDPKPNILWNLNYNQDYSPPSSTPKKASAEEFPPSTMDTRILRLSGLDPDLAVEDSLLMHVKDAWEKIVGEETGEGFLLFDDKEGEDEVDGGAEEGL